MATPTPAWASAGWQFLVRMHKASRLGFYTTDAQAERIAQLRGWEKWKPPAWAGNNWIVSEPGIRAQFYAHGQTSGGAGGGGVPGGPGTSGSPPPAAGVSPQITMGAESVEPEIVDNNVRLNPRKMKFRGLDSFSPDEQLSEEKSPYFMNWNAIERAGSWCARKGLGRLIDDGTTCEDSGSSPITSTHKGLAVLPLELNDPSDANAQHTTAMLLCFSDADGKGDTGDINFCVVEPDVAWGYLESGRGYPGPALVLSNPSSGTLRVQVSYVLGKYATRTGMPVNFVRGITIAYSSVRYPRDVDKRDDGDGGGSRVTLFRDRASYDGTTQQFDIPSLPADTYYVTVWIHTLEGTSEPVFGSWPVT